MRDKYKPDGTLAALAFVLVCAGIPFQGWVRLVLWRWFLVPLGAPSISLTQMLGVTLALHLVVVGHPYRKDGLEADSEDDYISRIVWPWVMNGMTLALGFIIKGFL